MKRLCVLLILCSLLLSTACGSGAAENPSGNESAETTVSTDTTEKLITIDDFDKVKIQVGKILSVEPVQGSSKLLLFHLDFGDGNTRQILSGIRKFYPDAAELLDKKVLAVTNLKPRKMLGHESQGMLLSSEKDGEIKLALVGDEHPLGALLG